MAGHSHWAGIKHKKGRADKERSKIFSKLSREITVAAKLGDKEPNMNPRLRTAIQAAKQSNMPKDNIARAISKSEMSDDKIYENLRYEGFGSSNVAFIIETLTDNKNRSASSIRTVLQKNGGRLGETGSATHMAYPSCTSALSQTPEATIFFAIYLAIYAPLLSTFEGSFPEKAHPQCLPIQP